MNKSLFLVFSCCVTLNSCERKYDISKEIYDDRLLRSDLSNWYYMVIKENYESRILPLNNFHNLKSFEQSKGGLKLSREGNLVVKNDEFGGFYVKYVVENIEYSGLSVSLPKSVENKLIENGSYFNISIDLNKDNEILVSINSRAGFVLSGKRLNRGSPFYGSIINSDGVVYLYRANR